MAARGVDLIVAERARQTLEVAYGGEGYDSTHDDGHAGELAAAAASYATAEADRLYMPGDATPLSWPWAAAFWKPTPHDRLRGLVKAGALIAAAIDSLLEDAR